MSGFTTWQPGPKYSLEASEVTSVQALYNLLIDLEGIESKAPRNLALALRSFTSIYERWLYQAEDRIVDAITAIEAVMATDTELSFKLAFRVAGILADNDDERVAIFQDMKSYYGTRSRIVHGASLKSKDLETIQNDESLRNIIRRLLVAFLHLVNSSSHSPSKRFYQDLDCILQHSQRRSELRKAMGLV